METSAATGFIQWVVLIWDAPLGSKSENSLCVKSPEAIPQWEVSYFSIDILEEMAYSHNSLHSKTMQIYPRRNRNFEQRRKSHWLFACFQNW